MAKFLVRDYTEKGYREVDGPLPRTRELSYVPWGILADGRVVYAPIAEARGRANHPGMRPYDTQVSKERRSLCHTALGLLALGHPEFSRGGVRKVSVGMCQYMNRRQLEDIRLVRKGERKPADKFIAQFAAKVGKYLYGMSYKSFGRISDEAAANGDQQIWNQSFIALMTGKSLPTILSIHDGVGRLLLRKDDPESVVYDRWKTKLRAESDGEIINEKWRGRQKKDGKDYVATAAPGNVSTLMATTAGLGMLQLRNRGVDMYNRITSPAPPTGVALRPETSAKVYYEQLDLRNELFGAGPSGTTGTCLAAAFAFGKFDAKSEQAKEYIFAIIGYLVGGGMHSLHESLSILRLVDLEYNTGTLLGYDFSESPARTDAEGLVRGRVSNDFPLLPKAFLTSKEFADWRDAYWDVVMLGGTHWRFNAH